jgi:chromate transport protein ChrA
MHTDLVEKRRWISEHRFLHALNDCMLLPGPEATQLATYIGWLMHRTWGGIIAGTLFVLPSLAILIALSWVYIAFGDIPVVAGVLYGIKPAVVAIVLAAAWRIGSRILKNSWLIAIAVAGFIGGWDQGPIRRRPVSCRCAWRLRRNLLHFPAVAHFHPAGGPLVESTPDNIKLTAPLTAISAAVVGVIVSLAVFFAEHVFNIAKPVQQWDFLAIAISLAACIALFRFKMGTIKLIGACGLAGLLVSYLV